MNVVLAIALLLGMASHHTRGWTARRNIPGHHHVWMPQDHLRRRETRSWFWTDKDWFKREYLS